MDEKEKYLSDDKEFQKFLNKNVDVELSTEDDKLAYYFKLSYLKDKGKLPKIGEDELQNILEHYERVRELNNAKLDYLDGKIDEDVYLNIVKQDKEYLIDKINEINNQEEIVNEELEMTTPIEIIKENKKKKKVRVVRKKLFMLASYSFVFFVFVVFLLFYILAPKIELVAGNDFKLEYGTAWEEPGYAASYFGKDITSSVYIEGAVNDKELGKNVINYNIRKNRIVITKKRIVTVVDTTSPEIVLEGEDKVSICPNKEYEEQGYKATDLHDGDVTNEVKIDKSNEEVKYTVTDKSGNKQTVARQLIREDKEAPVIELSGNDTVYIIVNGSFTEPGYKATDNCDDDLTSEVKIEGEVNTKTAGEYTLKYKVSDKAGNSSEKERKVIVQNYVPKVGANYRCGNAGYIYLTFDDGPNGNYTPTILDVLKKYNVKATFFVLGQNASARPDLLKREVNEGHAVGIHTWSHEYADIYSSTSAFWNEVNRTHDLIKNQTGYDSKLIRFPGGSSNTVSRHYSTGIMSTLAREVVNKGYNYFDWNESSGDAGGTTTASGVYNNVISQLSKSKGNVILMHDIKSYTMNAVEDIVKYGKNNGYTFDVLNVGIECKQATNN
jgi:peptidoglycan/xylan/chitin deacetylase (PgdA/CDA1 family)